MQENNEGTQINLNTLIEKIKNILSWTRKQVELNELYYSQEKETISKPHVLMGDIYYAYLGTNIGAEIDKGRPVLVFQNDSRYIRQSNLVFVIPISSNIKPNPYKVIINLTVIILNEGIKDSSIIIQQARSISKNRLHKYKGHLSEEKIKEVAVKLTLFLYKDNPLQMEGDAQTIQTDAAKSVDKV
jgi:mRNA-degrading endonuclease toxin of MazEF toxin-antitoxin module